MAGYVFISYARVDHEYVGKLANYLRGEGIDTWFDEQMPTGRRFDQVLKEKIERCSAFVLVMTPAAHASDWVVDELDWARVNERDLMPILLDGDRFFGLGRRHCEYLQGGEMPSQQFVRDLKALVGEGELLFEMKAHKGQVRSVAYPAANPAMVASAGPEACVRIWDPATGELRREIPGATWPISFTRYGDKIATGGQGNKVHLWDTSTGELLSQIGEHKKALTSVAISDDGSALVTGSSDTTEHVWDVATRNLRSTFSGRAKPASPLVISPDGTWLVAPTEAGSTLGAGLWSMKDGRYIGPLKGHRDVVHDVTVSWDGRYVATAGKDHTARIWDAKTGDELHVLGAHRSDVRAVAFSPDGYRLATGGMDQTIRLWDARTGAHIRCITNRAGGIYDLAYSPNGRTLASGHGDGAIRIWTA